VVVDKPRPDFGIDLFARRVVEVDGRQRDGGIQLDLQLKSTSRVHWGETSLRYDLDVGTYDDLRDSNVANPRVLVLLVVPEDEAEWVVQTTEELRIRRCAYWLSLWGREAVATTATTRVEIPLANVVDAESLPRLFSDLRDRRRL
jgi:hypothetical protein